MNGFAIFKVRVNGSEEMIVPFHLIGNRRYLTDKDIVEHPCLKKFVAMFAANFEYDDTPGVLWFTEPLLPAI